MTVLQRSPSVDTAAPPLARRAIDGVAWNRGTVDAAAGLARERFGLARGVAEYVEAYDLALSERRLAFTQRPSVRLSAARS